jgi:hypothetical protein
MKNTTKKINSKRKGNSAELELAKIFSTYFGRPFARVGVTSGARTKNTVLPDNVSQVMTGDIIAPEGFRFSIESKAVDVDVDFFDSSALLDKFVKQAEDDAVSIGKIPMLCWKRNRKGWIVAVPTRQTFLLCGNVPVYRSIYRTYLICRLDSLFNANSGNGDFWFERKD